MEEAGEAPGPEPAGTSGNEQDALISRLIAKIAELEEKLYHAEFNEEKVEQQLSPPKLPEAPRLGFLSAIKQGLRQLEESTGYVNPAQGPAFQPYFQAPASTTTARTSVTTQPPSPSQYSPRSQQGQPRIVYYQPPPQEIADQLQLHQGTPQLQVETSHASNSSQATATSAADWISVKLGFGAASTKTSTPRDSYLQQYSGHPPGTPDATTSTSAHIFGAAPAMRPVASDGQLNASSSSASFSSAAVPAFAPQTGGPSPFREGLSGGGTGGGAGLWNGTPAAGAGTPGKVASDGGGKGAADWFSSFFKKERSSGQQAAVMSPEPGARQGGGGGDTYLSYNERTVDLAATVSGQHPDQQGDSYYRYVFDPVDIAAEMEVTSRVRKAAAEALMQAEEKLRAAEQAQAAMVEQLEQSKELSKELDAMRVANEAALATRAALEDEMISSRAALEATRAAQETLQQELEGMRTQAGIWQSATSDEQDKLKQENQLLRSQMQTRLNELQVVKSKLNESDTERQRQSRDLEELTGKLQWLTKINKQLETSAQQLEAHRKLAAEVQEKFMKERAVRRRLHEQLQQLRGNIRVMCRVRPAQPNQGTIISYPLEGLLAISPPDRRPQDFEFDHVFGPDAQQQAIYDEVSPLVRSCADGYNVCIFAYGQTGSGKTFTMEGQDEQPGINVRALQELFSIGSEEGIELHWKVQVSMLEVYNDTLHDLLLPAGEVGSRALDVSGLGAGELPAGAERVPGAIWRPVNSLADVKQVLREGSKNRSTAATALNASSSRSHAVLSVRVTAHASNMALRSTIHLVDLAGSERVDKSEVTGQQLKEAQSINKSLSALGDVISALQRRTPHIPFRNSKLTQVLQDSLCGTSKVLLVCNISPESCSASETLSSLNFASRAAQVELGQARKVGATGAITAADRMPSPHPATVGGSGGGAAAAAAAGPPAPSPERVGTSTHAGRVGGSGGAAREAREAREAKEAAGMRSVRSSQKLASGISGGRDSGGRESGGRDSSNGSAANAH